MANPKHEKWITDDGLLLLSGWARDGLTDEQIAFNCGVHVSTLYRWKNNRGDIREALKKGKEVVDYEVENSLLKRAKGYNYTEVQITQSEKDGEKIVKTVKHVPPDVTACAIWLNNRRPDKFRRNANKEKLDEKRFEHDKDTDSKRYF